MDATLNYKATSEGGGAYSFEIFYSIENKGWFVQFSGTTPAGQNEAQGTTSTFMECSNGDIMIVYVAKTDVDNTYYKTTYTATGSGTITASEHNINTTINALT